MTTAGEKALKWMMDHRGKFGYSNNVTLRLRPLETGVGDCSSVIRQAYLSTSKGTIDPGMYARFQAERGTLVARGRKYSDLNPEILQPGDIIAMDLTPRYPSYDHVEMYVGKINGVHTTIGHGGYPFMGPNLHPLRESYLLPKATAWVVRRHSQTRPTNSANSANSTNTTNTTNTKEFLMALSDKEQKDLLATINKIHAKVDKLASEVQKIKGAAGRLDKDRKAEADTRDKVNEIHEEIKNG